MRPAADDSRHYTKTKCQAQLGRVSFAPLSGADGSAGSGGDRRQFALQCVALFGTFSDVRMIVVFPMLLATVWPVSAQEQERKLIDRLLKPNMSLANPAQDKQFSVTPASVDKRAPSQSFNTRKTSRPKSFAGERAFVAKQFATQNFVAGDSRANISTRHVTKTDAVYFASAVHGTRVAPESDATLAAATFAGNRPFLGQGKSQKALSAQDTPLTIEQVRELLNKNK